MRQKWMVLGWLVFSSLPVLGSCGVTDLQLRDFILTTASRAIVTTGLTALQAIIVQG